MTTAASTSLPIGTTFSVNTTMAHPATCRVVRPQPPPITRTPLSASADAAPAVSHATVLSNRALAQPATASPAATPLQYRQSIVCRWRQGCPPTLLHAVAAIWRAMCRARRTDGRKHRAVRVLRAAGLTLARLPRQAPRQALRQPRHQAPLQARRQAPRQRPMMLMVLLDPELLSS